MDPQQASASTLDEGRPQSAALAGLRICDLSGILAGAGATRLLAAFGAQVIRVEDPTNKGRWDITRGNSPYVDDRRGINLGGTFNNHNVEKLGVTLNLRSAEGKALFLRLVAISDVVTENFSAGVMERLGLGYDRLQEFNEQVIYVANSGFGKTGPYSHFKTFGPVVQAVSGLTFNSAIPDQPPAGWGYSYMDHMGANVMAFAILAALVHRNRSGRGLAVDMSCCDAALGMVGPELLDSLVNDRPPRTPGMVNSNADNHPVMVPHDIYPASGTDSWVSIACRDDRDWAHLAQAIGDEANDPRFEDLAGRTAHKHEVSTIVSGWTSERQARDVERELQAVGVPVSVVSTPEQRIDHDAATADWGLWPTVQHPEMGDVRVEGIPVHLSATDWVIARGAPCLGQHNQHVFGELLGLSDEEIAELSSSGVI